MGLDSRGRLLAPRDERFLMEVRSDLPQLESRDDQWVVHGRGEPLALSWKPERPRAPEAVQVRERTADGSTRAGMMVGADPVRFRYEFPAVSGIVNVRAQRWRRLAGTAPSGARGPSFADDHPASRQGARVEQPGVPQRR